MKSIFNEEIAMDMLIDNENGMSYPQIGKKYNLSASTVFRHIKKIRELLSNTSTEDESNNTKLEPKEIEEPQEDNTSVTDNNVDEKYDGLNLFCSKNNLLICGLVADRHDMPIDLFIFDTIDSDLMFDYYMQESMVREFILNHINFDEDGIPDKDIVLYLSGLQCALESVFLLCEELHINLTTAHYNTQINRYRFRNTISKYPTKWYNEKINSLRVISDELYQYKCNINDLVEGDYFYSITEVELDENFVITKRTTTIIQDYDLLWPLYGYIIKKCKKINKTINIYVNTQQITFNGYIKIDTLTTSKIQPVLI